MLVDRAASQLSQPDNRAPCTSVHEALSTHRLHPPRLSLSAYIFPISPIPMIPTATSLASTVDILARVLVQVKEGEREGKGCDGTRVK